MNILEIFESTGEYTVSDRIQARYVTNRKLTRSELDQLEKLMRDTHGKANVKKFLEEHNISLISFQNQKITWTWKW